MRFVANPGAAEELARASAMATYLETVADQAAREVDRRAPKIVKGRGMSITSDSTVTAQGAQGRVIVQSPFWHWAEFGSSRYRQKAYLRPGTQAIISKYGGRWKNNT